MPEGKTLSIAGLEAVYDALAQAIDEAGPEKSELLLVKLALLCAHQIGDPVLVQQLISQAAQDIEPS